MGHVLFERDDVAYCATGFRFDGQNVRLRLSTIRKELVGLEIAAEAVFPNAVIRRIEESAAMRDEWPLEVVNFDVERRGKRWEFTLNCETVEWVWESDWPTVTRENKVGVEERISVSALSRLCNL